VETAITFFEAQSWDLPISNKTKNQVLAFIPGFRQQVSERGTALGLQNTLTTQRSEALEKLHILIADYMEVLNMNIRRKVYPASVRPFFELDINKKSIPKLTNENDIVLWTQRVIEGDQKLVDNGHPAMTSPTVAEVQTAFTEYNTLKIEHETLKTKYDLEQEDVENLRAEADNFRLDICDQVEFYYRADEISSKRRKCRVWGVVYISRPGEPAEPVENKLTATSDQTILDDVEMGFNAPLGEIIEAFLGDTNTLSIPMDGTTIFNNHTYVAPGTYQLAFTGIEKVREVHMNSSRLTSFNVHPSMTDLNEIILQGNLFTTPVADKIVIDVNNLGTNGPGKVLSLAGSEPLSAAGLAAKAELESRGWIVIVG